MKRVHTISFTGISAPGGVPRFNRYLHKILSKEGFDVQHWCWDDVKSLSASVNAMLYDEYSIALETGSILARMNLVKKDDIIIGDGFWCHAFTMLGFKNVISVAHGIWGHVTKTDIDKGVKIENHALDCMQRDHRLIHNKRKLPIVAVSQFIHDEMNKQNGIESIVINNAIDESEIKKVDEDAVSTFEFYVLHGINDILNKNKGWDHISCLMQSKSNIASNIMSLDKLFQIYKNRGCETKMQAMQLASVAIAPSGFEGNSYFMLELLMCGVPVICYDVGLPYEIKQKGLEEKVGIILDRNERSPELTVDAFDRFFDSKDLSKIDTRSVANELASFDKFKDSWISLVKSL